MTTTPDSLTISVTGLMDGRPTSKATLTQRNTAPSLSDGANVLVKPAVANSAVTQHPEISAGSTRSLHQVVLLNKYLNDSGQPNRYRVAPNTEEQFIQEINPATGDVIGEYPVSTFPTLARSLGLVGALVNSRA
jgi:hypothetical protein